MVNEYEFVDNNNFLAGLKSKDILFYEMYGFWSRTVYAYNW